MLDCVGEYSFISLIIFFPKKHHFTVTFKVSDDEKKCQKGQIKELSYNSKQEIQTTSKLNKPMFCAQRVQDPEQIKLMN